MINLFYRRTGQRSDPAFIVERHTAFSGVTVWVFSNFVFGTHDLFRSFNPIEMSQIRGRYFNADCAPMQTRTPSIRVSQRNGILPQQLLDLCQQCLGMYDILPRWTYHADTFL
ncbi:hypothetical protein TNCV_5016091 [Trichonephila clavipes]|nr:hypothetical protein TNCV_5016091 [Trichonephila clavipes]